MFAVLYGLFTKWMGRAVDQYAIYLLVGIVGWNFFQKATTYGMTSLRRGRALVLNYRFPREIVVLSAVAAVCWSSLMETTVLLVFAAALGRPPHWTWAFLPGIAAALALLTAGTSLVLAVLSVEFEDMDRIWEVLVFAAFYLTPIFYPMQIISEGRRAVLRFNPLTQIIAAARSCLIEHATPDLRVLGLLLGLAAALCAVGVAAVRRREHRIADRLMV